MPSVAARAMFIVSAYCLFRSMALAQPLASGAPASDRFSVEDLLQWEGVGEAVADPEEGWIFFERIRPYREIGDYSFRLNAFRNSGHQVWRYKAGSGSEAELLPGIDQTPSTYIVGLSPSGTNLVVLQYHFGQLSLGVYNVRTGGFQRLPFTPAMSRDGLHTPVWLSEDRIAYSVQPEGEPPSGASIRPGAASMLADAWRNAWTGSEVTAQVLRNPPDTESENKGAIVCADLSHSQTKILANGRYAGLKASSSGRFLAAAEHTPEDQIPDSNLIESDRRSFQLAVLALDKSELWRPLTNAEISPASIEWSADKDSLIVFAWPKAETSRSGRFYLIEPANRSVVKLDHSGLDLVSERERGFRQIPERAIPIGDGVALFARKISSTEKQTARFSYEDSGDHSAGRADWYYVAPDRKPKNLTASLLTPNAVPMGVSGDDLLILSEEGLFKVTVAGGSTKVSPKLPGTFSAIQSGSVMSRTGLSRQPFSNHLLLAVSSKTQNYAVLIGAQASEAIASRAVPTGTEPSVIMAGLDQSREILLRRDRGLASDLVVQRHDSAQQAIPIATLNKHLRDKSVGQWRRISYSVRTGSGNEAIETKLTSCILMPNEDAQRKRPPPLVVEVYPNAGPTCDDGKNSSQLTQNSPYIWIGRGYAYARLTLPRELTQTDDGPISRMPEIAERGVDALVDAGLADGDRVVLFGFSQGGVSSLFVGAHSSRFKAIIAENSWSHFASHYFGGNGIHSTLYGSIGSFGRYEARQGGEFGLGVTPFEDPSAYTENSPVFLAPNIEAPVLLIHSDMDYFSMSQFDEMYGALLRSGKEVEYLRYLGEGHGPSSPANITDMWGRIFSFLESHGLGPEA